LTSPPSDVAVTGTLVLGRRFTDANGDNVFLVTTEQDARGLALHAYHLARHGNDAWRLLRRIDDFVHDCELDATLKPVEHAIAITDLDGNHLAEVSFAYRQSCKGDVSPDGMKLMMLENGAKYAMRGSMVLMTRDLEGRPVRWRDDGVLPPAPAPPRIDAALRRHPRFHAFARARWSEWSQHFLE
jgi:hypothetical protein